MRTVDLFIETIRNVNESGLKVPVFLYGNVRKFIFCERSIQTAEWFEASLALKMHSDMYVSFDVTMVT